MKKTLFFLLLSITFISCNTTTLDKAPIDILDEAFINDINNFDSTAIITDKAIATFSYTTYYIIVITSHDSLFSYCGSGPFFKLYYNSKEIGSKVRSLHYN